MNDNAMTIEQLIDYVQNELTVYGALDKYLQDLAVMGIIRDDALQYFYNNYNYATMESFYRVHYECLLQSTNLYQYVILPDEIESVYEIFKINGNLISSNIILSAGANNFPISLGQINQPYLASQMSTIGDIGVYRSIVSAFADEIAKMTKEKVGFDFNPTSKQLILQGGVSCDLLLRVFVRVQPEYMYNDELFKKYTLGTAYIKLANILQFVPLPMPGGFNFNAEAIRTVGNEMLTEVKERIKKQSKSTMIFIRR